MRHRPRLLPSAKKLTLSFGLLLALAPPPETTPPTPSTDFPPEVDAYLSKALRDWEIPGMAVAVVHEGKIRAKGYGVRELGRPEPVDVHTLFDSASLTKSFTSTLVAMLVEEGKMKWDEPIKSYLPALDLGDPYLTEHATVRDFLSHRTGLAPTNRYGSGRRSRGPRSCRDCAA